MKAGTTKKEKKTMIRIPKETFKTLVEKYPDYVVKAVVDYNGVNKGDWMMFDCLLPETDKPQEIHSSHTLRLIVEHKHFEII